MNYHLGLDIGSSSIKAVLVDIKTGKSLDVVDEPKEEMGIHAQKNGWAKQKPNDWLFHICKAISSFKKNIILVELKLRVFVLPIRCMGWLLLIKQQTYSEKLLFGAIVGP